MTAWQQYVLVLCAFDVAGVIYAISRTLDQVLEEVRHIRQALEKRAGE